MPTISSPALALIGLHLVAIGLYARVLGQNLMPAMIGYGSFEAPAKPPVRIVGNGIALIIFSTAALAMWELASTSLCT